MSPGWGLPGHLPGKTSNCIHTLDSVQWRCFQKPKISLCPRSCKCTSKIKNRQFRTHPFKWKGDFNRIYSNIKKCNTFFGYYRMSMNSFNNLLEILTHHILFYIKLQELYIGWVLHLFLQHYLYLIRWQTDQHIKLIRSYTDLSLLYCLVHGHCPL